jgi:hypothetical protein
VFFDTFIGSINLALRILRSFPFRVVAARAHGSFSRIFKVHVTG